ncbi:ribosome assembly RNA-binding protein YhbY [Paenibacillus apiarius]|uniref:Ribosome assembly RNA-binding protein YhbY n=1 Tax=Paenibacillus apiarius TaxID=46240 RepID=A0ABT4DWL4_9BACL|nr:ribosome assembly RNA-binding protein YhbY [Paenibacillus apiarius]MBN3525851.1 ribosome assembly RNA-binding protein YhbY [Paenibacillus apiarius]MCY9516901.1 ribosome assembly RNA-binding protein YhbY [Paenibacillus apiarius]MCY9521747.1 ribosome assembly RNA-binding protein YhbY [Paenibacillus apiarius]MCY9551572.1 ribosome assembly RNA-binding protein YhbY [Paenibacillus apiarius]MCY9558727.1 ribosome assembly RNA-binding protein YhbY [Paenibacillus apiarius]
MLTGKQKRYLRSLAHHIQPIFQVGKGGTNDQLIRHIQEALEVRELIKVSILNNCLDDRYEVAEQLSSRSGAELVQVIGKTIVLYKESEEKKQIELP